MVKTKKNKTLDKPNPFFDDYFENMDLNEDLKPIYEIFNDDQIKDKYNKSVFLNKLRNENHKRYYDIDINRLNGLPNKYNSIIFDITSLYSLIDSEKLLNEDELESQKHKQMLDEINKKTNNLREIIEIDLSKETKENDEKESKFSVDYFNSLNLNEEKKKNVLEVYNDLILNNAEPTKNIYSELKKEVARSNYIKNILFILDNEQDNINYDFNSELENINVDKKQNEVAKSINIEKTKELANKTDTSIIVNNQEIILGLKNTVNYIIENYHETISEEENRTLSKILNSLINNNCNLEESIQIVNLIIKSIWSKTITDIYSYSRNKSFYFVCSNNQFIDEKYQTILITKKELQMAQNYFDFQIGFICNYNNNILYITDKEDIMKADMKKTIMLKTPLQLEAEFDNFKSCNKIALDGYNTKITAVYFIDDGNKEKYLKAVELANENTLPLIVLKKGK